MVRVIAPAPTDANTAFGVPRVAVWPLTDAADKVATLEGGFTKFTVYVWVVPFWAVTVIGMTVIPVTELTALPVKVLFVVFCWGMLLTATEAAASVNVVVKLTVVTPTSTVKLYVTVSLLKAGDKVPTLGTNALKVLVVVGVQ